VAGAVSNEYQGWLHAFCPEGNMKDRAEELLRRAATTRGLISLAGGLPDARLFPRRALGKAFLTALEVRGTAALQYGWPEGLRDVREHVADRLRRRGANVAPERIIITSGAQQAILLSLATLGKCGSVGVDAETYPGALAAFRSCGARPVELGERADAYYVMPAIGNPRGLPMPERSKTALLERLGRERTYAIEDDAYEATAFSGASPRPLLADLPERVFHVGTFSKTLCPGLRIGWLVPPVRLAARALKRKQTHDLEANGLAQALLAEYLAGDDFDRRLARARRRYQGKAELLCSSVRRHLPSFRFDVPRGGFSLWLESDLRLNELELLSAAVNEGVSFDLGSTFKVTPSEGLSLRLCFSAAASADLEPAVARLARALRRVTRRAA
jgi:2-aminoadipate transaminase